MKGTHMRYWLMLLLPCLLNCGGLDDSLDSTSDAASELTRTTTYDFTERSRLIFVDAQKVDGCITTEFNTDYSFQEYQTLGIGNVTVYGTVILQNTCTGERRSGRLPYPWEEDSVVLPTTYRTTHPDSVTFTAYMFDYRKGTNGQVGSLQPPTFLTVSASFVIGALTSPVVTTNTTTRNGNITYYRQATTATRPVTMRLTVIEADGTYYFANDLVYGTLEEYKVRTQTVEFAP